MVKFKALSRFFGRILPKRQNVNRPRNRPSSNKRGWSALWGRKPRPDSTTPNGPPTSRGRSAFGLRLPSFKNKNQRRSTVEDELPGPSRASTACSGPGDIRSLTVEMLKQEIAKEKRFINEYCKKRLAEAIQPEEHQCTSDLSGDWLIIDALEEHELQYIQLETQEMKTKKNKKRVTWKDEVDMKERRARIAEMGKESTELICNTECERSSYHESNHHLVKPNEKATDYNKMCTWQLSAIAFIVFIVFILLL